MTVARVTDSTAAIRDVDPRASWHVVPLEVEIDGARYREGPELSAVGLHRMLQEVNTPPVTLPPSVDRFTEAYAPLLDANESILSIHLSGELSDTIRHAREAAERLGERDRVVVFDSRLAGAAVGLLCLEADVRLARGETLDGVLAALTAIVASARTYFSVYTLDYLYLGGRLERQPRSAAATTEDRPLLALEDGRLVLIERLVGETTRVERMIELLGAEFADDELLVAAIVHAGARGESAAQRLERALGDERLRPARCYRAALGPVLCAHTGFDVCGVAVYPGRLSALGDSDRGAA
jgi:DegV family protein with EDD domain